MFKKSLLLTFLLLLVVSFSAFAGEGSDTIGGGKLLPQLRYGYSTANWESPDEWMVPLRSAVFDSHDFYLQCDWGIFENVDLIAVVGGQALRYETEDATWEGETGRESMFMWGLGFRTTFFRADNGFYVGGGALFTHSFGDDFVFDQYIGGVYDASWDIEMSVYRLTPEIHAGWHIGDTGLTPYLGADYTWTRMVTEWSEIGVGDFHKITFKTDKPFFFFAGIDYHFNNRLYVNLEGRANFNGDWGIGTGVGYLFDICAKPVAPAPAPAPVIEPKLEPMSKN